MYVCEVVAESVSLSHRQLCEAHERTESEILGERGTTSSMQGVCV